MSTILSIILGSFIGSVVSAGVTVLYSLDYQRFARRFDERKRYFPVSGISASGDESVNIVLPFREGQVSKRYRPNPEKPLTVLREHVRVEDMLAQSLVSRVLGYAGVESRRIRILTVADLDRMSDAARSSVTEGHLVLIGSSLANRYTKTFLTELFPDSKPAGEKIRFQKEAFGEDEGQGREEYVLRFFASPPGRERILQTEGDARHETIGLSANGQIAEGFGVAINAPNPRNQDVRVIIIAGTRGFGTWGAAKAFREPDGISSELLTRRRLGRSKQSEADGFAMFVRVIADGGSGFSLETTRASFEMLYAEANGSIGRRK